MLLAWMLGGTLVHFLALRLASFVGAASAIGGILLLPLAALALLVAYVAMLLVLRPDMPRLAQLAPLPDGERARRISFLDGVLGGILPFVAFYAAWGFIREDVTTYINDASQWSSWWGLAAAARLETYDTAGRITDLGLNATTIGIVVLAFTGRWLYKRFAKRLPRRSGAAVFGVIAVYLEVLWVYLAVYVVSDLLGIVQTWIQSRQAIVWLGDFRAGLTGWLAPFGVAWDGVEWLLGEAGGVILLPVAWLTIAGVIYGQAVKAAAPRLAGARLRATRDRYAKLPARLRRRLADIGASIVAPFRSIGAALILMWGAGPVVIAGYVLCFTLLAFAQQWALVGVGRAIGPQDVHQFWVPASVGVVAIVTVLFEPLRVALIAATYDRTVGALEDSSVADAETHVEDVALATDGDDDLVGASRVVTEEDRSDEVELRPGV